MKKVLFNKKQSFIFALVICCVCAGVLSCKFNLEPAWKAQTSLRIQVANYDRMFSDSRAVIGSGGYIYISSSSKEAAINGVYGPYKLDANNATTIQDIPAGSYTDFIVLYSPSKIDLTTKIDDLEDKTIKELFLDASFIRGFAQNPNASQFGPLLTVFNGNESIAIQNDVVLSSSQTNTLNFTLVPITMHKASLKDTHSISIPFTGGSADTTYLAFTNVAIPSDENLEISISDPQAKLIAFDSTGKLISGNFTQDNDKTSIVLTKATETIYLSVHTAMLGEANIKAFYNVPNLGANEFYVNAKGNGTGKSKAAPIGLENIDLTKIEWNIDDLTLVLCEDVALSEQFEIPASFEGDSITITSAKGKKHRLSCSKEGQLSVLLVGIGFADKTLSLKNLIIDKNEEIEKQNSLVMVLGGTINIDNCTLKNGGVLLETYAWGGDNLSGGALYLENCIATITNSIIQNNKANYGGGISAIQSTLSLDETTSIKNNESSGGGGGIYARDSTLTITGSTIDSNTAEFGGGGINITDCDYITLNDVIITKNMSNKNGGGIYISGNNTGKTVTINDGNISYNTAAAGEDNFSGHGGGICAAATYDGSKTNLIINNTHITNNSAGKNGGGIGLAKEYSTHTCTISMELNGNYSITKNEVSYDEDLDIYGHGGGVYVEEVATVTGVEQGDQKIFGNKINSDSEGDGPNYYDAVNPTFRW